MKSILLFAFLFSCISASFSQEEDEYFVEDSAHLSQFLQQVDYIELCELGLTCYVDSAYVDDTDQRKLVKRCFLDGAIKYHKIDYSKIICSKRSPEINSFFQVFISSTKNKSYISGACYQPRNGIIFFDKEDLFLAYLEICFECHEINGINNFGLSGFTSDQYAELECLFNQNGLKTK